MKTVFSNLNLMVKKQISSEVGNEAPYLMDGILIEDITVQINLGGGRVIQLPVCDWDVNVEEVIVN